MRTPKIFNLSLHRSATESFSQFMADHGFRATHWPGLTFDQRCRQAAAHLDTAEVFQLALDAIEAHQVFGDVPYCFLYREILAAYPNANYLIILRPVQGWIKSVRRHIGNRELDNMEKLLYGLYIDAKYDHIFDYTDAQLEGAYIRHLITVVNLAQIQRVRFRSFQLDPNSLEQTMLMAQVAQYLGFQVRTRFPTINVPQGRLGTSSSAKPSEAGAL
jgi:hypothetical protein